MRALICSTELFDQDKIQITMKISSLIKFRIIDHELCVCEPAKRCTKKPRQAFVSSSLDPLSLSAAVTLVSVC
jgi:hypothetical protein